MAKVKFTIDGREITAEAGSNLLEVARSNGFDIPSLCHDPRLEPFGACRQCLVEIDGAKGPVQSCGAKVSEGMVVRTATENIFALRKLGLELLLTEHCGDCIAPCQLACPAGIDIQGFVAHIANGNLHEASALIREKLPLPASVGRVCPRFCETDCRRNLVDGPVSICALKRFVGDVELDGDIAIPPAQPDTGKQVAVVGGGPAGLSCAYYLALAGHRVSIFDASPQLGGMMRYGIPEYRLPKAVLDQEIKAITDLCQAVYCNKTLGKDFTVKKLRQMGFDAVFVGVGSWANQSLGLDGEDLAGVFSGIGFLGKVALKQPVTVGKKVVVIGGGNTAMDASRTSVRLGADQVTVVYRRSREEMPASHHEVVQAEEEGVQFELLTAPLAFIGEAGRVRGIKCVKMELGEPDASGRRRPVPIKGTEFEIAADMVITATGQKLEDSCLEGNTEIALDKRGNVAVDQGTMQSATAWLFSGGDCVTGPATVVQAVAAGRRAAGAIDSYVLGRPVMPEEAPFNSTRGSLEELDPAEFAGRERIDRAAMPTVEPAARKTNFEEFELGLSAEAARRETDRCLSCGCMDVFNCRLREYATLSKVETKTLGLGKKIHEILNDHPHVVRDPNKCVLCGNCVRICQEVQGTGALGFVNRGSGTVILPALKSPLEATLCNSCGQCINICPTGALTRQSNLAKPGPWVTEDVESICTHCNIGCRLELNVVGGQLVGVTSPISSETVNGGSLCIKGSFGNGFVHSPNRLRKPLVKKDGVMTEVGWEEAIAAAGGMMREVRDSGGLDSIAVVVSPRLTNEENFLAYKLGRLALGTNRIVSSAAVSTGGDALGKESNITFDDLQESDLILAIGGEISENYPIAAHKVRKAVANGSKLLIISPTTTILDSLAQLTLKVNKQKFYRLFEGFVSYVIQYGLSDVQVARENSILLNQLQEQVAEDFFDIVKSFWVKPQKVVEFIHQVLRAKNPVVLVDGSALSAEELAMLRNFVYITGNLTQAGRGMLPLYPQGNLKGQLDLGIKTDCSDYQALLNGLDGGVIKGLVVIGDGTALDDQLFKEGVKTVVITPILQEGIKADIVLPGATFAESNGTMTNVEGRIQKLAAALEPLGGKDNYQILVDLALALGYQMNFQNENKVYSEVLNQIMKKSV